MMIDEKRLIYYLNGRVKALNEFQQENKNDDLKLSAASCRLAELHRILCRLKDGAFNKSF